MSPTIAIRLGLYVLTILSASTMVYVLSFLNHRLARYFAATMAAIAINSLVLGALLVIQSFNGYSMDWFGCAFTANAAILATVTAALAVGFMRHNSDGTD